MKSVQELITKHDWNLSCWDDRYGRGIWGIAAPHYAHSNELREITDGSDIESLELGFYLAGKGSWLPVVRGENLAEVMQALDAKASIYVNSDPLRNAAYKAFQHILEENYRSYGLAIAVENKEQVLLEPEEFLLEKEDR